MLFLSIQCRSFSIADPDSHLPFHLHHIQEKYLSHLVQCICRNQFSFPTGMWASTCKVSQWKPAAPLLEAVHELKSITDWCVVECGEGAPVSFASSATAESKKSHQSANEGFVSPASLWSALCFTLSVRMVSVVQPPVSSLLLHTRVADGERHCSSVKTSG